MQYVIAVGVITYSWIKNLDLDKPNVFSIKYTCLSLHPAATVPQKRIFDRFCKLFLKKTFAKESRFCKKIFLINFCKKIFLINFFAFPFPNLCFPILQTITNQLLVSTLWINPLIGSPSWWESSFKEVIPPNRIRSSPFCERKAADKPMRISMLCSGNIVHAAPFYELRSRKNAETLVVEKRLVDNFNFDVFSGAVVELDENFKTRQVFLIFSLCSHSLIKEVRRLVLCGR